MGKKNEKYDIKKNPKTALQSLRRDIINMAQNTSHVAPALSCVDIIATLYFEILRIGNDIRSPGDVFILSKGHGAMALYSVLARAGFLDPDTLNSYAKNGSLLAEHPLPGKIPSIHFATGSLGHGLAVAAGFAKGYKLKKILSRVFVLLGDGECDEGSVWEAAAAARSLCLDNLTAIIDWNGLQACGACKDISSGMYLPDCWHGFGWDIEEVDGHNYDDLKDVFTRPNNTNIPRVVFSRTIKGKGVPFMEGNLEWHYRPVRGTERDAALRSLSDA